MTAHFFARSPRSDPPSLLGSWTSVRACASHIRASRSTMLARSRADTVPLATCQPRKFERYGPASRPTSRAKTAGLASSHFDFFVVCKGMSRLGVKAAGRDLSGRRVLRQETKAWLMDRRVRLLRIPSAPGWASIRHLIGKEVEGSPPNRLVYALAASLSRAASSSKGSISTSCSTNAPPGSRGQEDQGRSPPPGQERQVWKRLLMRLHRVGSGRVRLVEAAQ
jgi:hypothetical protein